LITKFPGLATSGRHNYTMITDRQKFTTKLTLYGMSRFPFLPHKKGTDPIFSNVRCPILCIKTSSTPQCWCCPQMCCLARQPIYILKKSRLNWKLKIMNAADNADITQSQARDTRHRRMQEVNSWCTDSGPLLVNTVLFHLTQCSLLVA